MLDQIPSPLTIIDHDLTVLFANRAALSLDLPRVGDSLSVAGGGNGDPSMMASVRQLSLQTEPVNWQDSRSGLVWQLSRFRDPANPASDDEAGGCILLSLAPEQAGLAEKQLRDISHRLKNTLQLISSLLTLQSLTARSMELRHAFKIAGGRVGIVSQLHQTVGHLSKGDRVEVTPVIRSLCEEISRGGATIILQADTVRMPVEAVQPFALILYELLGNANTHAYALSVPGEIEVVLRNQPDGGIHFSVSDHGRGLPQNFDLLKADSLGMKVVRAFAGQLKGKLAVFDNGPGTRITLDLPPT